MKKFSIALAALLLMVQSMLSPARLLAAASAAADEAFIKISVRDYCEFLNGAPRTTQEIEVGSWQIGADVLELASILRSGSVGNYRYEVIPGKENMPMSFLSYDDVVAYFAWKNFSISNLPVSIYSIDHLLKTSDVIMSSTTTASQASEVAEIGLLSGDELEVILGFAVAFSGGAAGEFAGEENLDHNEHIENNDFLTDAPRMPPDRRFQETTTMDCITPHLSSPEIVGRELETVPTFSSNEVDQDAKNSSVGSFQGTEIKNVFLKKEKNFPEPTTLDFKPPEADLMGRIVQAPIVMQLQGADAKILEYSSQAAQEQAQHGEREQAQNLSLAVSSAHAAKDLYERVADPTTMPQIKMACTTSAKYLLKRSDLVIHGETKETQHLLSAATIVRDAARNFEQDVAHAVLPSVLKAYEEVFRYSLEHAEEISINGNSEKAQCISLAIITARGAGDSYKNALVPIMFPNAVGNHDEEKQYLYLKDRIEGIFTHGIDNETFSSSVIPAMEKIEGALSHAIKAYEEELKYRLQLAQELATNGETEKAQDLLKQADEARKVGDDIKNGINGTTLLKAAWNNVVLIKEKIKLVEKELLEADAAGKEKTIDRLEELLKNYQAIAVARIQAAQEIEAAPVTKAYRSVKDHELIAKDNAEIFEKIEWLRDKISHETIEGVTICWQSMIETYGKILSYRKKIASDFALEQRTPEMNEIINSIERCYSKALDAKLDAKQEAALAATSRFVSPDNVSEKGTAFENAARSHIEALSALKKGGTLEKNQWEKVAKEYETLAEIKFKLGIWDSPKFVLEHEHINSVLSAPDADGIRNWKDRQKFDFPERLAEACNSHREVIKSQLKKDGGEKKLIAQLIHRLEIIEKNNELLSLITKRNVSNTLLLNEDAISRMKYYLLKAVVNYAARDENSEKTGDAYGNAIKALLANNDKSNNLEARWKDIAELRKSMEVDEMELKELSLTHRYRFVQHQYEYIISLQTQTIKGVEESVDESEIAKLDAEVERLKLRAKAELNDIKHIIREEQSHRVRVERGAYYYDF